MNNIKNIKTNLSKTSSSYLDVDGNDAFPDQPNDDELYAEADELYDESSDTEYGVLHIENTSSVSDETLISAQLELSAMIEEHLYENVFSIDGGEYMIFDTYEEAEQVAIDRLKDDIEYEPELFTPGFLENHIDREKLTRDLSSDKENMLYDDYNYMSDEELKEEAGIESVDDFDEIGEVEFDKDAVVEQLVEQRMQEFDGVEWLEEMYGSNWYSEFKNIKYYIDEESAAQEAVNVDGVAHFLSTYDGNQVELDNGGVMFRTN